MPLPEPFRGEVWDVDGNRFLDFAAGIAVCATGHAHPQVVQAIKDANEWDRLPDDWPSEQPVWPRK